MFVPKQRKLEKYQAKEEVKAIAQEEKKQEKVYQPKQQKVEEPIVPLEKKKSEPKQQKPVVMVYQPKQVQEGAAMFGALPGLKVLDPTLMEKF